MTLVPEVQLASELGFLYASVALITDYDCWHSDELSVSVDFVMAMLQTLSTKAKDVLVRAISKIKAVDWTEAMEKRQKAAKVAIMVE